MVRACPSYAAASCVTSQSPAAPDDGFSSSAGGAVGAVLRASPRPRSSVILFTDGAASSSAISEVRAVFLSVVMRIEVEGSGVCLTRL